MSEPDQVRRPHMYGMYFLYLAFADRCMRGAIGHLHIVLT